MQLTFSNRLDALAEELTAGIFASRQTKVSPLLPIRIAVPNQNLATWLRFRLAEPSSLGVCLNVKMVYLEQALFEASRDALDLPKGTRMATQELMTATLIGLLDQEEWEDSRMEPLRSWFKAREPREAPDYGKRIQQAAARLASLFLEYACQRRDMLKAWKENQSGLLREHVDEVLILEQCQAHLYRRMRETLVSRASEEEPVVFLEDLPDLLGQGRPVGGTLWLFGLSHVSEIHYAICRALNPLMELSWLTFNPCREYWEDVKTPWEISRFVRKQEKTPRKVGGSHQTAGFALADYEMAQGTMFFDERDPRLLQWWGRPGREHIRSLCDLAGHDFSESFRLDVSKLSLLKLLQAHLLSRSAPEVLGVRLPQDRSVQMIGAPSMLREVEGVQQSILRNMKLDPDLQLTDIAVLVPDMKTYRPSLMAVFASDGSIPFNLVDSRSDRDSLYANGILAILKLLETEEITRPDCFALLENSCFQKAFGLTHDHLVELADAFETLGMRRGLGDPGPFSIRQGIWRLIRSSIQIEDESFPPALVSPDEKAMQAFLTFTRFIRMFASKKPEKHSVEEWLNLLLPAFNSLLLIEEGLGAENRVREGLLNSLEILREALLGVEIRFSVLCEHIRQTLGGIPSGIGTYLSGGVTLAELHPMRPIPFKIVYVLGLGESGGFPGTEDRFTLDLRRVERRIGDVSLPERRRWLFLEVLSAVQEKIYFSFVSRDLESDRDLEMSSILHQLKRHVEEDLLPEGDSFEILHLPLRGSDSLHGLKREYSDFAVNYRDRDHVLHTKRFQAGEIEPNLPVITPQETSWRLSHLADFLREPAYAVLRHRYGHTPAWDQNLWRIGDGLENFGLSPFQDTRILEHLTLNRLHPAERILSVADVLLRLERRSLGPQGRMRQLAFIELYESARTLPQIEDYLNHTGPWEEKAFASQDTGVIGVEPERFQLVINQKGEPLILCVQSKGLKEHSLGAYLIRPYLNALLYASTQKQAVNCHILKITPGKVEAKEILLKDAKDTLQTLCQTMRNWPLMALPIKAAILNQGKSQDSFEAKAREELADFRGMRLLPLPVAELEKATHLKPYLEWLSEI